MFQTARKISVIQKHQIQTKITANRFHDTTCSPANFGTREFKGLRNLFRPRNRAEKAWAALGIVGVHLALLQLGDGFSVFSKKHNFSCYSQGPEGSFPVAQTVKESSCNVGDLGSIPGLGRSPGEGNGNLLRYSCLENSMDGGAWWATVHGSQKVKHD